MEIVSTIFLFLLTISTLVAVHEYGHFIVARFFGVKVLRFSVGFGPRIFSWNDKLGTEFCVASIPLGGYVKMWEPDSGESGCVHKHAYSTMPAWQRLLIALAGPAANFLTAIIIYTTVLFLNGTTMVIPVIGEITPNSPADEASLSPGHRIVSVDGKATQSIQALNQYLLHRVGTSDHITFTTQDMVSGDIVHAKAKLTNWLDDSRVDNLIQSLGITLFKPHIPAEVGRLVESGVAFEAGLKPGDRIIKINGEKVTGWSNLEQAISARPGLTTDIEVQRSGEIKLISLIPEKYIGDDGVEYGRVGMYAADVAIPDDMLFLQNHTFGEAFIKAIKNTTKMANTLVVTLKKLIFGEMSVKNLSGPIGIAKVANSHAEIGGWVFLLFLAQMSIVLGVMNLLPLPVLDGGQIVFCVFEMIKGSPVSDGFQNWAAFAGSLVLFGVMAMAMINDVARL